MTQTDQHRLIVPDDKVLAGGLLSVPILYRFSGELDSAALSRALDRVVDRHEALRITYERVGLRRLRENVQPPGVHLPLGEHVVSGPDEADRLVAARMAEMFDPDSLPLTADLYRLTGTEHLLLINVNHRVTDAWSNALIRRDLAHFYNAEVGVETAPLPAVEWRPGDYYAWRDTRMAGEPGRRHAAYWETQAPLLKWAGVRRQPEKFGARRPPARLADIPLAPADVAALRRLAAAERTTLYAVLLAVLFASLHAATAETGLVACSIHANRVRPEVWNTVGQFANLSYLRVDLPPAPRFADVLKLTRAASLEALAHQEYPLLNVVTHPGTTPRTVSRAGEVAFNMLASPPNADSAAGADFSGLRTASLPFPAGVSSHFDLEVFIAPRPEGLSGVLRWAEGGYEPEFAAALAGTYASLVSAAAQDPAVPLAGFREGFSRS
ncbi:condensation domain-containing protein [Actinoplanes sp. N902-109]|uniref:condensation domain-containing protein n=1 Tax=Actinoplanes sp. (strain N902-109) TaxID=649831 RepID=UPI0003295968|nr:condensation domain-containing protein [Actinoplanes sp. N902-109]AGL16512.1 condensation domain-containing protein [Actinoplanes sp. N902-109]